VEKKNPKVQQTRIILGDVYENRKSITGYISILSHQINVGFEGYGDCGSKKGYGFPILIENQNGIPHVVIYGDINQESPTHVISLENAADKKNNKRI
jgi:hypothetical protein